MTQRCLAGDKSTFAIEYIFCGDTHDTELFMYIDEVNILAFKRNGEILTTRWNLDDLALWLREFVDHMANDPYPVDCAGEYAAKKDDLAREYDTDDDDAFEAYYQSLYEWNLRHRWHTASSGAILADVYFERVDDVVEISWDNRDIDDSVSFLSEAGGARIPIEQFTYVVNTFLIAYANHWFNPCN